MRNRLLLTILALAACSVDSTSGEGGGGSPDQGREDSDLPTGKPVQPGSWGPCGLVAEYHFGELEVAIPVECDPIYIYDGMPPDLEREVRDRVSNPGDPQSPGSLPDGR